MDRSYLKTLLALSAGQFEFYNRHRGNLEGDLTYYEARPNGSWTTTLILYVTVTAVSTAVARWGGVNNEETTHPLTVGENLISYNYTSTGDTRPEDMGVAIADRQAPEKLVQVRFSNNEVVTGLRFNRASVTRFGEQGIATTTLTEFACGAQLLENLPPLPRGLHTLSCGIDLFGNTANAQPGNKIPFQQIREATALCVNDLEYLIPGTIQFQTVSSVSQDVPYTQVYDLSIFPNLKEAYIHMCGVIKVITTTSNTTLQRLVSAGSLQTRPVIDFSEFYVPPSMLEISIGSTNNQRAETTITPLQLQTAVNLNELDLRYVFNSGSLAIQGVTETQLYLAFYNTIYNLYLGRANHAAGPKTANIIGKDIDTPQTGFPAGIREYLQTLTTSHEWTFTFTGAAL